MQRSGPPSDSSPAKSVRPLALTLAAGLAALPLGLEIPVNPDQLLPVFVLPALWLAWRIHPQLSRLETVAVAWLLAAIAISSALSKHSAAAWTMGAAAGLTLAGALATRALAQDRRAVRIVLAGMLAGGVLGLALVLSGPGPDPLRFPVYWSARIFGGHAFAAALAGMALLIEAPWRGWRRGLVVAGVLLVWIALAWSGSRAPALGLAVALCVWFWRGGFVVRKRLLVAVPALAVLALALSRPLGTPYPQLGWWPALTRTIEAVDATSAQTLTSDRTAYWRETWNDFLRSPWSGRGADAYRFIQPKQPGNQPHNTFLQWLLEYGVLGAPALLLLLALALRPLRLAPPQPDISPVFDPDYFPRWAAASMAGAAAYAAFDGVAYHAAIFIPAAMLAGLALRPPSATATGIPPWPMRAAALAAVAILLVHNWLSFLLLRGQNIAPRFHPRTRPEAVPLHHPRHPKLDRALARLRSGTRPRVDRLGPGCFLRSGRAPCACRANLSLGKKLGRRLARIVGLSAQSASP